MRRADRCYPRLRVCEGRTEGTGKDSICPRSENGIGAVGSTRKGSLDAFDLSGGDRDS